MDRPDMGSRKSSKVQIPIRVQGRILASERRWLVSAAGSEVPMWEETSLPISN